MRLAAFIIILLSLIASAHAEPAPPFQIEEQKGREVVVILGESKKDAPPSLTIVSATQAVAAKLLRVESRCVDLCAGTEPLACHNVGIYLLESKFGSEALAAIESSQKLELFGLPKPRSRDIEVSDWVTEDFQSDLIKDRIGAGDIEDTYWRWKQDSSGKGAQLESSTLDSSEQQGAAEPKGIELSDCEETEISPFELLVCKAGIFRLLYFNKQLALVSYADYGEAAAEPVARISIEKKSYYLVKIGLKAEIVYALLTQQNNKLKLLIRARDFATLC